MTFEKINPNMSPVIRNNEGVFNLLTFKDAYDFESYMQAVQGDMYMMLMDDPAYPKDLIGHPFKVRISCLCFYSDTDTPTEMRVCVPERYDGVSALWFDYGDMYGRYGFYRRTQR